MQISPPSV